MVKEPREGEQDQRLPLALRALDGIVRGSLLRPRSMVIGMDGFTGRRSAGRRLDPSSPKTACPCCGYLTISLLWPTCAVCRWESDPIQDENPEYRGGANDLSLNEARESYARFGVSDLRFKDRARDPLPSEIPGQA